MMVGRGGLEDELGVGAGSGDQEGEEEKAHAGSPQSEIRDQRQLQTGENQQNVSKSGFQGRQRTRS